jgi:hypothetical protein
VAYLLSKNVGEEFRFLLVEVHECFLAGVLVVRTDGSLSRHGSGRKLAGWGGIWLGGLNQGFLAV